MCFPLISLRRLAYQVHQFVVRLEILENKNMIKQLKVNYNNYIKLNHIHSKKIMVRYDEEYILLQIRNLKLLET